MKILIATWMFCLVGLISHAGTCPAFYITKPSNKVLTFKPNQILELPSGRKMQVFTARSKNLKKGDEIIVSLTGLGKSFDDLNLFVEASLAENKTVVGIDLLGQGDSLKLNPGLDNRPSIPYRQNVEDLIFLLKEISKTYKVRLVSHSYSGAIVLSALTELKRSGIKLPITKSIFLSPFVQNLDKYYGDALVSGKLPQVVTDLTNPLLNQLGVPAEWIKSYDMAVNKQLFQSNQIPHLVRDVWMNMNPALNMWKEWLSTGPNYMANIMLAPAHMVANANLADIAAWQKNPMLLTKLVLTNIALINGARDLNHLDYSIPIELPEGIEFKFVIALNDSVVPNTMSQEYIQRLTDSGYNVVTQTLNRETHYFMYGESIKKLFRSVILD